MASTIIYELWVFIEKQISNKSRKTVCVETHVIFLPVADDDVNEEWTVKTTEWC